MNWSQADLTTIAPAYRAMVFGFVEVGAEPLSIWLVAVLTNDLAGTLEHCPPTRDRGMTDALAIIDLLQQFAPQECWGSRDKVHRWINGGGLRGQIRADVRLQ